VKAEAGTGESG